MVGVYAADAIANQFNATGTYRGAMTMGGNDFDYQAKAEIDLAKSRLTLPLLGSVPYNIGNAAIGMLGGPTEQSISAEMELANREKTYTALGMQQNAAYVNRGMMLKAMGAGSDPMAKSWQIRAKYQEMTTDYNARREAARLVMEGKLSNENITNYWDLKDEERTYAASTPIFGAIPREAGESPRATVLRKANEARAAENALARDRFTKDWDRDKPQLKLGEQLELAINAHEYSAETMSRGVGLESTRLRNQYRPYAAQASELSGSANMWRDQVEFELEQMAKTGQTNSPEFRNRFKIDAASQRENIVTAQRELRDRDLYGNTQAFDPFSQSTEAFYNPRIENMSDAQKSLEDAMRELDATVKLLASKIK
jgi:hypothetical protein